MKIDKSCQLIKKHFFDAEDWKTYPIKIRDSVISFERNDGELMLLNPISPSPLYVSSGKKYILNLMDKLKARGSLIASNFEKDDQILIEMLLQHDICTFENDERDNGKNYEERELELTKKGSKRGISLYLLLAQFCNLGCVYCLNGKNTYRKNQKLKMTEDVAYRTINEFLTYLDTGGALNIIFFGGEPLLNWPLAKKIILYCEEKAKALFPEQEINYHITTNLSFIPNDFIEWAIKYRISILCDIDGTQLYHDRLRPYKNGKGSHSSITKNIRKLVGEGINVSLRTTVTALNVDHIFEISSHHKSLGGDSSAFVPVSPITSDTDTLDLELLPSPKIFIDGILKTLNSGIWMPEQLFPVNSYIPRIKGEEKIAHGCGAPYGNTPVVDIDGNVYPCIYLVGLEKYYMGNIIQGTYPYKNVVNEMYELVDVDRDRKCKKCLWRYLCGGGCPIGKLTMAGNPKVGKQILKYHEEITCNTNKAIIEALLWKFVDNKKEEII